MVQLKYPKDQDENVDGPQIAARILRAMPPERRKRLMAAIEAREPAIFEKINSNIFAFEEIPSLTDHSLQMLVKVVDHRELVTALSTAPKSVVTAMLRNMSKRKGSMVLDDLKSLPQSPDDQIRAAQESIVKVIDALRTQGILRSKGDEDQYV